MNLMRENYVILIEISLKFVPNGPINNKSAFVQLMAWCYADKKPSWPASMIAYGH